MLPKGGIWPENGPGVRNQGPAWVSGALSSPAFPTPPQVSSAFIPLLLPGDLPSLCLVSALPSCYKQHHPFTIKTHSLMVAPSLLMFFWNIPHFCAVLPSGTVDGCMMSHFSSLYHALLQASWMCCVFTAKFVAGIFQGHGNCGDSSFCCCLCQPCSCRILARKGP